MVGPYTFIQLSEVAARIPLEAQACPRMGHRRLGTNSETRTHAHNRFKA